MWFTVIGLLAVTAILVYIGALGILIALFNDIGGAGSKAESLGGLVIAGAAGYGIYQLWLNFSPFTMVAL